MQVVWHIPESKEVTCCNGGGKILRTYNLKGWYQN